AHRESGRGNVVRDHADPPHHGGYDSGRRNAPLRAEAESGSGPGRAVRRSLSGSCPAGKREGRPGSRPRARRLPPLTAITRETMRLDIEPELLAHVQHAIEDIKHGKMVILVDDEDRENEGDLVLAADKVTPEAINFMAKFGRGLICLALAEEQVE